MHRPRRVAQLGCALAITLALPAAAQASSISTVTDAEVAGRAMVITAEIGETNDVAVAYSYDTTYFTISDTAGLAAGAGCEQVNPTTAKCIANGDMNQVRATLKDGDDKFTLGESGLFYGADVDGGEGVDTLTGGNRPDLLSGGPGNDVILGGGEGDLLFGEDGLDIIFGQGGDDEIIGGADYDAVDAGGGDDLVNSREVEGGLTGTADAAVTCGDGGDRVATDINDPWPDWSCENVAPRVSGSPTLTDDGAVVGRTLRLDTSGLEATGLGMPERTVLWLACAPGADECDIVAEDVDEYVLDPLDEGLEVGAVIIDSNGSPAFGLYSTVETYTRFVGPVTAKPVVNQPGPVIKPPTGPTSGQQSAVYQALAAKALGVEPQLLKDTQTATVFRALTKRVTVRGKRKPKVLSIACKLSVCPVAITAEVRTTTRVKGRDRKRTIKLKGVRTTLTNGRVATLAVGLSSKQRKAVRKARIATLRVTYAVAGAQPVTGRTSFSLRATG